VSPLRLCLHPGCGQLTTRSRCDEHEKPFKQERRRDRPIARAVVEAAPWCVCRADCAWHRGRPCGETADLTADHVIPIAKGGTNDGERQVLCRKCGSSKGKR
jgi:5-methylcytosine-specific restriction endonuclease McrA